MSEQIQPHVFRVDSVSATVCADCGLRPANPIHLDARHLNPDPGIGQSRYKSIDHHLLALAERAERAEHEVARLRRELARAQEDNELAQSELEQLRREREDG